MNDNGVIITLLGWISSGFWNFYNHSAFGGLIKAIARFFRRFWDRSLLKQILVSDVSVQNTLEQSVIGKLGGRLSSWAEAPPKKRFWEKSFIIGGIDKVLTNLQYTSCRSFGFFFVTFVFFVVIANPSYRTGIWLYLLAAAAVLGILFIIINRSFYDMFGTSRFVELAAGFFGFDDPVCREDKSVKRFHIFYAVLGLVLGAMFAFLDLYTFIIAAGGLIGGILVIHRTEIGVYAAAFLMPIAPTLIILGICAVTVLSYFVKVFIVRGGAAVFKLSWLDALAGLFAVTLAYGVVISYRPSGSIIVSMTYILYILFFIAARNTLRTKKMLTAAMGLLALAGLLVALYGSYQQMTGSYIETTAWIDDEMFEEATVRIYSTLENPNVLGEYLIFATAIITALLYYLKKPIYKLASLGMLGVAAMCMIFTQSRGAWLGLLFAAAAFALMHDKKLIFLGIAGITVMPFLLPDAILSRFLSIGSMADSSTSYRVNIWLACLSMIRAMWFTGIGPGEPSFRYVYQDYSFNAVEAPHSHNLYLQVIIELGVFGFIILAAILITVFKRLFSVYARSKDKFAKVTAAALAAAMFGYLVQGMTDNVWYNYRVVAYFWMILAICGSLYEISRKMTIEPKKELSNGREG